MLLQDEDDEDEEDGEGPAAAARKKPKGNRFVDDIAAVDDEDEEDEADVSGLRPRSCHAGNGRSTRQQLLAPCAVQQWALGGQQCKCWVLRAALIGQLDVEAQGWAGRCFASLLACSAM